MKELQQGDRIVFKVEDKEYEYTVSDSFLNYPRGDNDAIFTALGLDRTDKIDLASDQYGYNADNGDWPEYKNTDFAAATRLVKALYDLCNIYNTKKEHEEIPF